MADIDNLVVEARKLRYEQLQENRRAASQLQGEYGRWLVASLLLVHGGSILLLAQSQEMVRLVLPSVFWWHVAGLLLALTSGFLAWMNWGYHMILYDKVQPDMIYDDNSWPRFDQDVLGRIGSTFRASIAFGIASALCILGAAVCGYVKMAPDLG